MDSLLKNLILSIKNKEQQNCIDILKTLASFDDFDVNNIIGNFKNDYSSILHECSFYGLIDAVKFLIEDMKANVNIQSHIGDTPLHLASIGGHDEVVRYLIDFAHADCNIQNNDWNTVLHFASSNENVGLVHYLIECCQVDPDIQNLNGETALHYAIASRNVEIVRYLIEFAHSNTDLKNIDGDTALHCVSKYGLFEIVGLLIDHAHIDPNIQHMFGYTALHYASISSSLHFALMSDQRKCVDVLLRCDNINTSLKTDSDGYTAEELAKQRGFHDIAEMIANYEPIVSVINNK